ncbi:hypothetical protein ACFYVR_24945 [Rhodococcus sp. NPDC003318]|uniref:hypothetical protein n=1 Tax=Rhodococcus sp. NPDC003318 TaxID=3364503 RepID=UPI0036B0DF06
MTYHGSEQDPLGRINIPLLRFAARAGRGLMIAGIVFVVLTFATEFLLSASSRITDLTAILAILCLVCAGISLIVARKA